MGGQHAASSGQRNVATEALDLISSQYRSPECRTAHIAERLGVTSSLLCHRFRGTWGTTIGQEVRRRRINEARRLLDRCPDRLVKEVAASVGYSRASYRTFLNAFRAETGMSPSDYQTIAGARARIHARRDRATQGRRTA